MILGIYKYSIRFKKIDVFYKKIVNFKKINKLYLIFIGQKILKIPKNDTLINYNDLICFLKICENAKKSIFLNGGKYYLAFIE